MCVASVQIDRARNVLCVHFIIPFIYMQPAHLTPLSLRRFVSTNSIPTTDYTLDTIHIGLLQPIPQ